LFWENQLIKLGLTKFKWQKNFYDTIIRNEKHYEEVQKYIYYNPLQWAEDEYN